MAYSQKVQDILSDYATGDLSAAQARKALKSQGYRADFREAKTGEIQVFPIDLGPDEEATGDYYAFAKGGKVESLNQAIDRVKKEQGFRNGGKVSLGNFKGSF